METETLLTHLDADANGLYDDAERKALLDALRAEYTELSEDLDADGDGKVSIQEQEEGRHPLSFRVPRRILQSRNKIPWAMDLFPEWIMTAYVQEDVAPGPVAGHAPRGIIALAAAQEDAALQAAKAGPRDGVAFAANQGGRLSIPGHRDARWSYRWCVLTFRIDAATGSGTSTVLLDVNQGRGPSKSSPKIWFDKSEGLGIQYVGRTAGGLDKRVLRSRDVVADGKTWNVVVCGMRQGRLFAAVNGVAVPAGDQPGRFSTEMVYETQSFIGGAAKDNMAWAYDAIFMGQTEPSEAMVRKMEAWAAHRLGFAARLPAGHPHRERRPVLDEEDFPYRYIHDDEKWAV